MAENSTVDIDLPPSTPHPGELAVRILDKPHGQGSKWRVIQPKSRVRVPPRGKPILVEVTTHPSHGPLDPDRTTVELINLANGESLAPNELERGPWMHFSKKSKPQSSDCTHYFPVKVFIVRTDIQFRVTLTSESATSVGCSTSIFVTNTGVAAAERRQRALSQKDPESPVRVGDENPDEVSSTETIAPGSEQPLGPMPAPEPANFQVPVNLNVQGALTSRGYITFSDLKLKQHVEELSGMSRSLSYLSGKYFRWRPSDHDNIDTPNVQLPSQTKRVLGFIAQDLQKTLPEIVHTTSDGWLTVEYTAVVPLIVEALKLHSEYLSQLKASAAELDALNESYRTLLNGLKTEKTFNKKLSPIAQSLHREMRNQLKKTLPYPLKRTPLPAFMRHPRFRLLAFSSAAAVIVILILSIGLGVGLGSQASMLGSQPASTFATSPAVHSPRSPVAYAPQLSINWGASNFFGGGFEDPTAWSSSARFANYSDFADILPSPPFAAGDTFLFLNASSSLEAASRSFSLPTQGALRVYISVWIYLLPTNPVSSFDLTARLVDVNSAPCTASKSGDASVGFEWQRLELILRCQTSPNAQPFSVALSAGALGSQVAVDQFQLGAFDSGAIPVAGDPVTSFGSSGVSQIQLEGPFVGSGTITGMKYAPDGKLVVATLLPIQGTTTLARILISRFLPNYIRDLSFGTSGSTQMVALFQDPTLPIEDWFDIDQQNRIWLTGAIQLSDATVGAAVVCLHANGSIDRSFGGDAGYVRAFLPSPSKNELGFWVKVFSETKILVGIFSRVVETASAKFVRFSTVGRQQASGLSFASPGATGVLGCVMESAQNIYFALSQPFSATMHKFDSDLVADPTYGSTYGATVMDPELILSAIAVGSSGAVILGGSTGVNGSRTPFIMPLNSSGQSPLGTTPTSFAGYFDETVLKIRVLPDNTSLVMTHSFLFDSALLYRTLPNGDIDFNGFGPGQTFHLFNGTVEGKISNFLAASMPVDKSILVASNQPNQYLSLVRQLPTNISMSQPAASDYILPPAELLASSIAVDSTNNSLWVTAHVVRDEKKRFLLTRVSLDAGLPNLGASFVWADDTVVSIPTDCTLDDIVVDPTGSIVYTVTVDGGGSSTRTLATRRAADGTELVALRNVSSPSIFTSGAKLVRLPSSGKYFIVSSGGTSGTLVLSRLLPDLTPDPSYFSGSSLTINPGVFAILGPLIHQPADGSTFLVGSTLSGGNKATTIMKFNSAQRLDSTFSSVGYLTYYSVGSSLELNALVLPGSDSKFIFVGGKTVSSAGTTRLAILKLNATSGAQDPLTWTPALWYTLSAPAVVYSELTKMEWDPVAKRIVIFGLVAQNWASRRVLLMRLDPDTGVFDCFGNLNGLLMQDWAGQGVADATYSDGNYYVSVNTSTTLRLLKYDASGWGSCGAACGNGVVDANEACDDGNSISGDGCSSACTLEAGHTCATLGQPCR